MIISRKRKKQIFKHLLSTVLSIVYMLHILLLIQVLPLAYPANRNTVQPAITVQWPLTEETIVSWGGDSYVENYHVEWPASRWAYDLLMQPYNTQSQTLSDYGIWEKPIISSVDGKIIAVSDEEQDVLPNQDEFLSQEGNYIYIEIAETKTFLVLNHLRKNSIVVKAGDEVKVGDLLGLVGNSGMSSEPHLHIHHQRQNPLHTLSPLIAEGLPLYFYNREQIDFPVKDDIIYPSSYL